MCLDVCIIADHLLLYNQIIEADYKERLKNLPTEETFAM